MDTAEREIEERKLALEERRVQLEERRARRSVGSMLPILIPVVVAFIAFGGSVYTQWENAQDTVELQRQQARDSFELKAAEIVMDSESPFGVRNRAIAMAELFPHRLGSMFARRFDPELASNAEARLASERVANKKELLKLLVEHPSERRQIVATWRRLFPGDDWVGALE